MMVFCNLKLSPINLHLELTILVIIIECGIFDWKLVFGTVACNVHQGHFCVFLNGAFKCVKSEEKIFFIFTQYVLTGFASMAHNFNINEAIHLKEKASLLDVKLFQDLIYIDEISST